MTTALVTGAGSGIGRAVAVALSQRGVNHLTLVDIDAAGLQATADLLEAESLPITADVGDEEQLTAAFDACAAQSGRIDIVVNNAAMMTPSPGFLDADMAVVDRVLATNVRGVLLGIRLARLHMAPAGGGSIVNTASGAGKVPLPTDPLYAATKAAVINLTRSSAPVLAADGITINAVCPGVVDTPMLKADGQPDNIEALLAEINLLSADEVAAMIADLALDPARTGEAPSIL